MPTLNSIGIGLALAVCLVAALPTQAIDEDLALRVQDAVGEPGGLIAVVLRTYASKPIGQGQVCLQAKSTVVNDPTQAIVAIEGAMVFSQNNDATFETAVELAGDPQTVVINFESLSGSINANDGPLAVVFLRLSSTVVPGQTFDLNVDVANSSLIDENGLPVGVLPRPGELAIRAPGGPTPAAASAEDTFVGDVAYLSFQTLEPINIGLGQVGFNYDPSVASDLPVVEMDSRHGLATFSVSYPQTGTILVQFKSQDGSLNHVPGDLVAFLLPISDTVPPDTESPISLDPSSTFLVDTGGQFVPLVFEADLLFIAGRVPGAVSNLTLGKPSTSEIPMSWAPDCGSADSFAIYRGDLAMGYSSLAPVSGACEITGTAATVPLGIGDADFFLVVPHAVGLEGSFGALAGGEIARPAPAVLCHPQGPTDDCAP